MGDPCVFCPSTTTGPDAGTPHGICRNCACTECRGFQWFDDRGFLCTGQPFLTKTRCPACGANGTRTSQAATCPIIPVTSPDQSKEGGT